MPPSTVFWCSNVDAPKLGNIHSKNATFYAPIFCFLAPRPPKEEATNSVKSQKDQHNGGTYWSFIPEMRLAICTNI